MTKLDDQIKKDMTELYQQKPVSDAVSLNNNGAISGSFFSTRGLPSHYLGDRKAKTVIVMLNPGEHACVADYMFNVLTSSYNRNSATSFIKSYKKSRTTVAIDRTKHVDAFDVKIASFLLPWLKGRIAVPPHFPQCPCSHWDAVEIIQKQRLQLELIPYSAKSFGNIMKPDLLKTFLETVFDEIVSCERDYVIFGSDKFTVLFDQYNKVVKSSNGYKPIVFRRKTPISIGGSNKYCSKVKIEYKGKTFTAVIAHSFFNRAFSKNYVTMEKYGEFCYNEYITYKMNVIYEC